MPNSDAPVSKTQAIRQYLAEHPDASPRAVAKALVAPGIRDLACLRVRCTGEAEIGDGTRRKRKRSVADARQSPSRCDVPSNQRRQPTGG